MDEEWKQTLEDFSRVWPRVGGGAPPSPPPQAAPEELAALIREETAAQRSYLGLAGKTEGSAAAAWARLAAGSRKLLRRLQTEYYLRSGNSCPVPRGPARDGEAWAEPHRAWLDAERAERAYLEAAGRAEDAGLLAVFAEGAEQKRRQREELRALCGQLFR